MFVIQVIEILWTKATRGAPRSNERVALPRAFALEASLSEVLVQRHRMAEWKDFAQELRKVENLASAPGTVEVLRVVPEGDGVFSLGILGTPNSGQPPRRAIKDAVRLLPGQWARIALNARHTSYSGQHYSETIFNVASGAEVPNHRFLSTQPDHDLNLKANLF